MADEKQSNSSDEQPAESRSGSTNRSDATKRTPGVPAGAKAVKDDPPMGPGPRDALVIDGHNEGDFVPDAETKGYHAGLVRQPVVALVQNGQIVGWEGAEESRFAADPGSLENLKRAHNAREKNLRDHEHRLYEAVEA